QYSALSPRDLDDNHRVNGALTIGENIGDLGGLSIAVKAYLASRSEEEAAAEIDGFTGLQRVLWAWATVGRGKNRTQGARLPRAPSRDCRLHVTAAAVLALAHRVAGAEPRPGGAPPPGRGPARPDGVPLQHRRGPPGRVPHRLRRARGGRDVPRPRGAGEHLVRPDPPFYVGRTRPSSIGWTRIGITLAAGAVLTLLMAQRSSPPAVLLVAALFAGLTLWTWMGQHTRFIVDEHGLTVSLGGFLPRRPWPLEDFRTVQLRELPQSRLGVTLGGYGW